MSDRIRIFRSVHCYRRTLSHFLFHEYVTRTHTYNFYNFSNTKMHDAGWVRSSMLPECARAPLTYTTLTYTVSRACAWGGAPMSWFTESKWVRGSRRMVGKNSGPPCLPFPSASAVLQAPLVPLWSSSYPLTRPPRDSQTPGDSQPPCPLRPTPRPSARRFFPRFPYLSDIPLPASTRVDVRLIRLKSRREATNYYAS